ncbi:NAD(P)-dependent dehydrogenase, short-chain alcohol dehydrogenase family [Hymenobacter gelipurpurascens]|uniref:NAD(P)-dependent dehydrogenase, short-chain alcohol dehydrogenase family n=1 Tax=Hymenobacter gelipurpurascens TaxID=89968 RepID=A0A212T524_9BACT|nr:SDR family oxidoreductase [Hymenobacter gelipurpurascens]SNC60864.1 NAD(P)-dependent dehydrogenase, short-chain alcohol dehydrogenase family [Hymenobacter gelipurpurascens]
MEKHLTGKTALVTGAGSGIGKAIALLYAQLGASVMVSDIDEAKGRQVAQEITQSGGQARFYRTDVSDPAQCEALVQETIAAFGQLDMACNNAGIGGELNPVGEYSLEGWKKVIDINLNSVFFCLKYELAVMKTGGSIINMASILGQVGTPHSAAYVAAKHGVVGLTQAAALEYAPQGIRINAVGPAYIDTPLLGGLPPEQKQQLVALHPLGRLGRSEEVAELVIWLSSDKASFVTGSYYPVDGGYLAR